MRAETNSTHAVDTNILIYAFDAHDARKNKIASRILREAFNAERTLVVTNQILAEFVSVARTKLSPNLTTEEITRFLRSVKASNNWEILDYTTEEVINAAEKGKNFWDSLIEETMKEKAPLLTENTKHFTMKTMNPFV